MADSVEKFGNGSSWIPIACEGIIGGEGCRGSIVVIVFRSLSTSFGGPEDR